MREAIVEQLLERQTVRFDSRWELLHTSFVELVYPKKRARRDYQYLALKLIDRTSPAPNLWLAIANDTVVGQLGLIEVVVNFFGQHVRAAWGVNLIVRPDYLGAGFGGLLELRALRHYPVYLGYGVSDDSERNQRKRGAEVARGPRMGYSTESGSRIFTTSFSIALAGFACRSFGRFVRSWFLRPWPFVSPISLWDDPQQIAQWLVRQDYAQGNGVVHDFEFYRRRLIDPVQAGYKKYVLAAQGKSYLLMDRTRGQVYLVDFHFSSLRSALRLLSWACGAFQIHRAEMPAFVNRTRDVFPFLLTGFLVSPKRQPVFVTGWAGPSIRKFFMTGLDSDATI